MSEVQWIKITTNMFNDGKIDFIESLPEADAILIVWIKLLTSAGKANANGFVFLTENIPYTVEMLSHKFKRPLSTVRLALETLQRLEMIEYNEEGFLKITNWEKHQNIEGLEKIRKQNRLRKQKQRERGNQKALEGGNKDNSHVTSRDGHATDIDKDKDIDIERDGGGATTRARTRGAQPQPQPQPQPPSIPDIVLQDSLPPPISHDEAMAYADRIGMRPADAEACYDHFQATDWQNEKIKDKPVRLSRDAVFAKMRRWKVRQSRINAENAAKRPASVSVERDVKDYGESDTGTGGAI